MQTIRSYDFARWRPGGWISAGLRADLTGADVCRVCSPGAVGPVPAASGWLVEADAPLAQSAERLHGKEKVYGSIP